jgi:4-hydroxy-tetrahydrodipicolinate synthase
MTHQIVSQNRKARFNYHISSNLEAGIISQGFKMNPIGCYTALITPFKEGILDVDAFVDLIHAQIRANIAGIIIGGTTGELHLLDDNEYATILEIAVKTAAKKVPIIAGVANPSTSKAVNMSRTAQNLGVDGLVALTPYYVRPTNNGVLEHFKAIHEATNLPITVYSNPRRTNFEIGEELLQEIIKMERIVGLKDSTTDAIRITKLCSRFQSNKFSYICGEDAAIDTFINAGSKAWISVISNLSPEECVKIMQGASSLHIQKTVETLNVPSPNPVPIKFAVSHFLKLCQEDVRLPLLPLTQEEKVRIVKGIYLIH